MGQQHYGGADTPPTSVWKRVGSSVAGLVTTMLLLVGGGTSAALAAPPYVTEATISDIRFVETSVNEGSYAEISATWALPDNPQPKAGFTIPLPAGELSGRGDKFQILEQGTGAVIANCIANETQLECDFDDTYITENPRNLTGDVHFWVRIDAQVDQTEEHTFVFGSETSTVTVVQPSPWVCTSDCDFSWNYSKDGGYNYSSDTITWWLHIAAGENGMEGGLNVEVRDTPGPNQTLILTDDRPVLQKTNKKGDIGNGAIRPIEWQNVPRSEFTIDAAGNIQFVSEAGYFYQVVYYTQVTDGGASETYTNAAEFIINGVKEGSAPGQVRYAGGGGTGIGTNVGVFSISKVVAGTATGLPADQTFTGTYTVTTPAGDVIDGEFAVLAGETWKSAEFPRDSTVKLTEVTPVGPENVTWETPVWSQNDFTLAGGTLTEVTLTNTANVKLGGFSLKKSVSGDASGLVPAGTIFTVDYEWAVEGGQTGNGTLEVAAGGEAVTVQGVPAGAAVTLTETTAAVIDGVEWLAPQFSDNGFTIIAGTVVEIALDNPTALKRGAFTIRKALEGDGATTVPAETAFTVEYAYPAGEGFEAGSGELTVLADGVAVQSDPIPYGAEVTLAEREPAALAGVTWSGGVFDRAELVIGDDSVEDVVLTNTYETVPKTPEDPEAPAPEKPEVPKTPETPEGPETPEAPTPVPPVNTAPGKAPSAAPGTAPGWSLATTGSSGNLALGGIALAALLMGAGAVWVARKRGSATR
ncbi:hypothetical protein JOF28_002447 [Leucobacter exalbidus]|uniref:DUF5979 domain-containing protein n=1 Tax=Leucobacter exalbidus TaxID=662960 RepID=A0A940PVX3_9MICO|nr:DUF5979 domain-containing protein [Leucobacter exalbidus]MBP1327215.1 hypothetical protein [Leucobacter exalbidus]